MSSSNIFIPPTPFVICAKITDFDLSVLKNVLSPEEAEMSARHRQPHARDHFVLSHALKRFFLGKLMDTDHKQLTFAKGNKGKPYCEQTQHLDFNLSHSGDWVAFAVSNECAIGVDIERAERQISERVIRYALSEQEQQRLGTVTNPNEAAIIYWSQKEAIGKALGYGISISFKTVECSGELGLSFHQSAHGELLICSKKTEDNSILTVASKEATPPLFYQLTEWHGEFITLDAR